MTIVAWQAKNRTCLYIALCQDAMEGYIKNVPWLESGAIGNTTNMPQESDQHHGQRKGLLAQSS